MAVEVSSITSRSPADRTLLVAMVVAGVVVGAAIVVPSYLGPAINTCATLYLPSGVTNVTSSGLYPCASGSP
jgi:hypothetical protein